MIKTIKIKDKEIKLDNNIGWTIIFRDQFGHDIVPSIMPILSSVIEILTGLAESIEGKKEIGVETVGELTDSGKLDEALMRIMSAEFVDFIDITWALAKNADDDIPEPKEWIRQFDEFPIDIIGPEVFKLVFRGMISSKNQKRMNAWIKSVHPTKTNQ